MPPSGFRPGIKTISGNRGRLAPRHSPASLRLYHVFYRFRVITPSTVSGIKRNNLLRYMNICIIGCGSIGSMLARAASEMEEIEKIFLLDRNMSMAKKLAEKLPDSETISRIESVKGKVELVIEAASQKAVKLFGPMVVGMGISLMIMSVGALVDDELFALLKATARANGVKLYLPSGAIGGVDVVNAAAVKKIYEISLKTSKPPDGLLNNEYITGAGIDVRKIERPTVVFDGSAGEAIKVFPLNINVATTLALSGIGKERTRVRIIVDPDIDRNVHELSMRGEFGGMKCTVQNVPHPENPKTSYLAALSAIAKLKKIVSVVDIGT